MLAASDGLSSLGFGLEKHLNASFREFPSRTMVLNLFDPWATFLNHISDGLLCYVDTS